MRCVGEARTPHWLTFTRRRDQSRLETCDSLARLREEHVGRGREWEREGEYSSHIRSPSQCNSVRFLSSAQRKKETGRRGKQRIQEKKGWDVKRVLVPSMHTASSSSVHERRSDKEIATKSERTWIKEGNTALTKGYICRLQEHYGEKTGRGWSRGNLQCHYRATKSALCAYILSCSACPLSMPCHLSFDVSFPVQKGGVTVTSQRVLGCRCE